MAYDSPIAAVLSANRLVVSSALPSAFTLPLTTGSLLLPTRMHARVM